MSARVLALTVAALLLAGSPVSAQVATHDVDARLAAHFDEASARAMQRVVDSAAATGVPAMLLIDKAVEGARKGVAPPRVLSVLRVYATHVVAARSAMGSALDAQSYEAAANALLAGVSVEVLQRLRAARPSGALVYPLVVLTDLTVRGVPGDSAGAYVARLMRADARDQDLADLQQAVARRVVAGARPDRAAAAATESALQSIGARARPAASDDVRGRRPAPTRPSGLEP